MFLIPPTSPNQGAMRRVTPTVGQKMCATKAKTEFMGEELITNAIRKMVDDDILAGAATLIWQDGKVIQAAGVGYGGI